MLDDGDELTISVGQVTHGHFAPGNFVAIDDRRLCLDLLKLAAGYAGFLSPLDWLQGLEGRRGTVRAEPPAGVQWPACRMGLENALS